MIEEMIARGRVVEPLAELYKVEVRELGERLGIPASMLGRHPFPGPGLGVRVLCSDGVPDEHGFGALAPAAEALASSFGLRSLPLPIRSVGVKADLRAYEHPVLLSGDVPWERLILAVSAITAKVPGVNRCVWNLGPNHPVSARPRTATVTRSRLDLLREADHIVMEALRTWGLYDEVWQCPTVLLPLALGERPGETVGVRPIRSQRAMDERYFRQPWKNDGRNNPKANGQIRRVVKGSSFQESEQFLRCSARSREFPDVEGSLNIPPWFSSRDE